MKQKQKNLGFTMLEMLLVVAIIAILAGIVILAINPKKQLDDTTNAQRRADVNTILNAVYQYAIDNNGTLPANIPGNASCAGVATNEICRTDVGSCSGLVDLSVLTENEKYLIAIPTDPTGVNSTGAGYHIASTLYDRVTVCAPDAENGETIEVTR